MYRNILEAAVTPPDWMSPEAVDVCTKLLVRDPTQRLGYRGAGEVSVRIPTQRLGYKESGGKRSVIANAHERIWLMLGVV